MTEYIELGNILKDSLGVIGIILPVAAFGYIRIMKRQDAADLEMLQVEKKVLENNIIEKAIKEDIDDLKEQLKYISERIDLIIFHDTRNNK
jgi:hypothetical protein